MMTRFVVAPSGGLLLKNRPRNWGNWGQTANFCRKLVSVPNFAKAGLRTHDRKELS
jgi:hypothetical protein